MKLEQAFELINNLDAPRKGAPRQALVLIGSSGKILDVVRYREYKSLVLKMPEHRRRHPKAICFITTPGQYDTLEKLQKMVDECAGVVERRLV